MPYSEAQKRATMKYQAANYERLNLQLKKGTKEKWKDFANKQGISLNSYIVKLVEAEIEKEQSI